MNDSLKLFRYPCPEVSPDHNSQPGPSVCPWTPRPSLPCSTFSSFHSTSHPLACNPLYSLLTQIVSGSALPQEGVRSTWAGALSAYTCVPSSYSAAWQKSKQLRRLNNSPKMSVSDSLEPVNVTSMATRAFADMIKLGILRWETILGSPGDPKCNHKYLY